MVYKNLEVRLREGFIKLYKEHVGRGPDRTSVAVTKNFVVVEYIGVFTKLEKNLLLAHNGEALIRNLRKNLKDHVLPANYQFVEQLCDCTVIDCLSKLSIELDALFLMFILDTNVEEYMVSDT